MNLKLLKAFCKLCILAIILILISAPVIKNIAWKTLYESGLSNNKDQAERIASLISRDLNNGIDASSVLNKFQHMLENTTQSHEHFACIVKGNNTVIAHPNPSNVGKDVTGWTLDNGEKVVSFDYAAKTGIAFGGIQKRLDGSKDLSFQSPIDSQDWVVAVHTKLDILEYEAKKIMNYIIIVLSLSMLVLILYSTILVRNGSSN